MHVRTLMMSQNSYWMLTPKMSKLRIREENCHFIKHMDSLTTIALRLLEVYLEGAKVKDILDQLPLHLAATERQATKFP
jgi:hypothetical protein